MAHVHGVSCLNRSGNLICAEAGALHDTCKICGGNKGVPNCGWLGEGMIAARNRLHAEAKGKRAKAKRKAKAPKAKASKPAGIDYLAFFQLHPGENSKLVKTFKGKGALSRARRYAETQREIARARGRFSKTKIVERSGAHTRTVYEA